MSRPRRETSPLLLAFLGILGFSFTLPTTKIAVRGFDPMLAASLRAVVAAGLSIGALALGRRARPTGSQALRLLVVAAGVVLGFPVLTAYAIRLVPAAHGAVVISLLPLTTAGLAVMRIGERPSRRYWGCSAAGFVAVLTFALHEGAGSLHLADLLLVLAVLVAAFAYLEGAVLADEMPGWAVISWALVLGLPVMAALTVGSLIASGVPDATFGQWSAFAYTAVVSMFVAFFAWYAGMAGAGVARAGQLQLLQPVLSILWCWPLLGEGITLAAAITAAVVITAVAIGRRSDVRGAVEPELA